MPIERARMRVRISMPNKDGKRLKEKIVPLATTVEDEDWADEWELVSMRRMSLRALTFLTDHCHTGAEGCQARDRFADHASPSFIPSSPPPSHLSPIRHALLSTLQFLDPGGSDRPRPATDHQRAIGKRDKRTREGRDAQFRFVGRGRGKARVIVMRRSAVGGRRSVGRR